MKFIRARKYRCDYIDNRDTYRDLEDTGGPLADYEPRQVRRCGGVGREVVIEMSRITRKFNYYKIPAKAFLTKSTSISKILLAWI